MNENKEIKELVETAASYAGILYKGLQKVAEGLRTGEISSVRSDLNLALEGLEWLISAASGLNSFKGEYGEFEIDSLSELLIDMNDSIKDMDYVLASDLIEFEILPVIDTWGNKLDGILGI